MYGHERRVKLGLEGKTHLIVKNKVNLSAARQEVLRKAGAAQPFRASRNTEWIKNVFPGVN
jgi:hypothetical protein